jgi:hypothetical protein
MRDSGANHRFGRLLHLSHRIISEIEAVVAREISLNRLTSVPMVGNEAFSLLAATLHTHEASSSI